MALTPFIDPNLFDVTRQMSRALEPFFQPMGFPSLGRLGGMSQLHPMDIVEHPDHYSIVADAPGFAPEDVTVEMRDNNIVINGEKRIEKEITDEKQGVRIHRNERTFSKFSRSFAVPEGTKAESITAKIENGVLTVDIPKVEQTAAQAEAKRIKVTGGGGTAGRITTGTEGTGGAGSGAGASAKTPSSGATTTGTKNV